MQGHYTFIDGKWTRPFENIPTDRLTQMLRNAERQITIVGLGGEVSDEDVKSGLWQDILAMREELHGNRAGEKR